MNQTNLTSLEACAAAVGIACEKPAENEQPAIDANAIEIACIDLICKLENIFAKAKQADKEQFVDESATTARKMLSSLTDFCKNFVTGKAQAQSQEIIDKAVTVSHTFDQVLKTRPVGKSILRTFWSIEESEDIKASHGQLADALIRACTAIFYHAVVMIGLDSKAGQQIEQSSMIFMAELRQSW